MSNNRKTLKEGLSKAKNGLDKAFDKSEQFVKEVGHGKKKIWKEVTDTAKSCKQVCTEKLSSHQLRKEGMAYDSKLSKAVKSGPNSVQDRRELTKKLDQAVWRAYYAEGGYRFFAQHLVDYVTKALNRTQSVEEAWIGGYNSNIQPMLTRMQKLEHTMENLRLTYGLEPFPLENEAMLEQMRAFAVRVKEDRLDQDTNWDLTAYIQTVQLYAQDLNERLLKPYPFPNER